MAITGQLGKINSVTASDLSQVIVTALKITEININQPADTADVSGDGETSTKKAMGLYGWDFSFSGRYPKSAPRFGASGLVTHTGGYEQKIESWELNFDFGELDITSFAVGGVLAKEFRPAGRPVVTGTYTARAVAGTALSAPVAVNSAGNAAVFKLTEDAAADPSFTGTILPNLLAVTGAGTSGLVVARYGFEFTGDVTSVAGSNASTFPALLPAGAIDAADWDLNGDGTADVTAVFQTYTSRTYTGTCFLRSLRVSCPVAGIIDVSGVVKGAGVLTPA